MTPPVLYLIFNRPDLVEQSFAPIRQARPKQLFIAADGPRADRGNEFELCRETRLIVDKVDWDCEVRTLFREKNLGCRFAVSSAIDWFFDHVEMGVIIEDDCVVDASFFSFCQELLVEYRHDERIMAICAEGFPSPNAPQSSNSSFDFSGIPLIWGWATWRRAWRLYDDDMRLAKREDFPQWLASYYQSGSVEAFWITQLSLTHNGTYNTWDYRWIQSVWANHGLAIIPCVNLVNNIGYDERATHTTGTKPHGPSERKLSVISTPTVKPASVRRNYLLDDIVMKERFGIAKVSLRSAKEIFRTICKDGLLLFRRLYSKLFGFLQSR